MAMRVIRDILCHTSTYLCWHIVCVLGGAITIADHVPTRWRTGASVLLAGIVVLPHVLFAWQETWGTHTEDEPPCA